MGINRGWKAFLKLCRTVESEEQLNELFTLFFTPAEREDMATRYLLVQALLKAEKPQREISKELNVSIAKITRGSNGLKLISKRLKAFLKSIML